MTKPMTEERLEEIREGRCRSWSPGELIAEIDRLRKELEDMRPAVELAEAWDEWCGESGDSAEAQTRLDVARDLYRAHRERAKGHG